MLAKTPQCGALELAGNILARGLPHLHAVMIMGAKVSRMSVAAVLRVLREAMEAVRFGHSTRWFVSALGAALKDDYHRRRPKRARDWPHKKNESPPGPPNRRRLKKQEITLLQASIHASTTPNI